MIVDPIDLKLLRHLEAQGYVPLDEITAKFNITNEEIFLRLKNFEETKLIIRYGLKLFIPAILGGEWYRGCAFLDSQNSLEPQNAFLFLEEVIENITLPEGVLPNQSFLFYSRDLKESYRQISKICGVKYFEVYKIGEYDLTANFDLSKEEWMLIQRLYNQNLDFKRIYKLITEPKSDDEVRLARLIFHRKNRKGLVSISPEIDWRVLRNFAHVHIAVSTKLKLKDLRKILKKIGGANVTGTFKKRYIQLEFDIWGFNDFHRIMDYLKEQKRIVIHGVSFVNKNRIYDEWVREIINERAK